MAKKRKSNARDSRQYAAIPIRLRKNGKVEVLLLTSRGKGRWGIPKGWPMPRRSPQATARREAFEEAGLKGRVIRRDPIGRYRYNKTEFGEIVVKVFVMQVERQLREWPEKPERKTRWFSPSEAAARMKDRRLSRLLRKAAKLASAAAKCGRSQNCQGMNDMDTGIAAQIATLREQIAAAEAEIENRRSRPKTADRDGDATEAAEAELAELKEAHEFMVNRLSRLESCQRALDP